MPAYSVRDIQPTDVVLGYSPSDPAATLGFTGVGSGGSGSLSNVYNAVVVATISQLIAAISYDDGIDIITIPNGFTGARLLYPPVIKTNNGGTSIVSQSGEYFQITSGSLSQSIMSQIPDSAFNSNTYQSGTFFHQYEMVENVRGWFTDPISGGGASATFTIYVTYQLF